MTKVMVWNIEDFNNTKISGGVQTAYEQWIDQLDTTLGRHPTLNPLDLLGSAVSIFPVPVVGGAITASTFANYTDFLPILTWAVRKAFDWATNPNATRSPQALATAFSAHLNVIAPVAWAKSKRGGILNGAYYYGVFTAFGDVRTVTTARDSYAQVLFYIFSRFMNHVDWRPLGVHFSLLHTLSRDIRGPAPNLAQILTNTRQEILRLGAANPQLAVLNHILKNVSPGGGVALPDILVVLEVQSQTAVHRYDTIDGNGAIGVMNLLTQLRTLNPDYCAVPPVRLSGNPMDHESIAVFYNAATLRFMGPQKWNGKQAVALTDPAASANYGAHWQPHPFTTAPTRASGYPLQNPG